MTFFARLILVLALAGCFGSNSAQAQAPAATPALEGRWNLVLHTPQGAFRTPVEFVVQDGRRVTANMLGPSGSFQITEASGTLAGDRLRLTVRSSFGNLRVNAQLTGDRLQGRWGPSGLVSSLFFRGDMLGFRQEDYVRTPPAETYDRVWTQLERHFYSPDFNGVDVAALRERYRTEAVATRTDGEFVAVMRRMLGEFRTSHLMLFATPAPPAPGEPPEPVDTQPRTEGVTWRQLAPGIGYLKIESFEDGPAVSTRIDAAFAALGRNGSLVIDVRENGGGSLSAAMRLGDHIFAEQRPVGYFASRQGLARHGTRSIDGIDRARLPLFTGYSGEELGREMASAGAVMLATGGRASQPYRGRLVVLIDEFCFSACEAFASVAKESGAATLIGRKTTGAMLAAYPVAIEGGWTLMLPIWDFRTPGGAQVEGRGVEPHIAARKDAEFAAALRFLRNQAESR